MEGAFHLPGSQLPSSGCFCNHSPCTQPEVPLHPARGAPAPGPPCPQPRARDQSIPRWGREGMDDQGLCCLLSCWAGFKVFGDINVLALPCLHTYPKILPASLDW